MLLKAELKKLEMPYITIRECCNLFRK